jgi:GTP-binding protein
VFEISALTREGCEVLVQKIFQHIVATREAEKPHVEVDPRFDARRDHVPESDATEAPLDDPRFRS